MIPAKEFENMFFQLDYLNVIDVIRMAQTDALKCASELENKELILELMNTV